MTEGMITPTGAVAGTGLDADAGGSAAASAKAGAASADRIDAGDVAAPEAGACALNLALDRWIPVRRRSGRRDAIALWEITDRDDPPVRLDWGRGDFDACCHELLIGMIFAAAAPTDLTTWRDFADDPPQPDEIREALDPLAEAFWLARPGGAPGPLFMQEAGLDPANCKPVPVSDLIADAPGKNSILENKDLFVWRTLIAQLAPPEAAIALFAKQQYASPAGSGYFSSLRGGTGFVSVLARPSGIEQQALPLWSLVWANIPYGDPVGPSDVPRAFPWMNTASGPTRRLGEADIHDAQRFFSMPLRIRLLPAAGRARRRSSTGF